MAGVRVEWHGKELAARVRNATAAAMNEVNDAVAEAARHDHPGWQSRTGEAEASIASVPARVEAGRVRSGVGFGIARGRFLEFTTRGHPGDRTVARAMERLGASLANRIAGRLR
ncbi:MAG: hypothetical protein M3T56_10320 [Chloroflexota bacterium]|nr:hypothetical protein [Chloroflexota bacterium]